MISCFQWDICSYSIFSIYHIMLQKCSHRATAHIIPTDIIPLGMRNLSTNEHAGGHEVKQKHIQNAIFVSRNTIYLYLCIFINFVMNLPVCGRVDWHSSFCVYTDQWSFGNHSGTKVLKTKENGADFMANPNHWVCVMGQSHGNKTGHPPQKKN